ncbi:biotin transporter BioY [Cumulibacter manganitolerans]|uniref:biotin transporter BioY n=1 Tax=Cumulibacter manganitolerans TaxID=1884992 RepID=UPI0012950D45|nr:biotin transporter BioY [Cumulibacter manganitolerans]
MSATAPEPVTTAPTAAPDAREGEHGTRGRGNRATDIALIAGFAALIAVLAILPAITVAGPVPITLQTFGVLLAGAVLGPVRGFLAVVLYVAVGAAGLPVFSGGAAGIAVLQGPSAGYLFGMPFAAGLCGFIVSRLPRHKLHSVLWIFLAGLAGSIVFNHSLGIVGLHLRAGLSWSEAWNVDIVFWPGDVIKNVLMALVATAVHRAFPDILGRPAIRRATREDARRA